MKRDLEIKPLIFKEEKTNSPAWSVLNIFEVLLVSCSVCILPLIEDDCEHSPLKLWATLTIALSGAHIGVFTLERVQSINTVIKSLHLLIVLVLLTWLGIGHYWVAVGIECRETSDFLISFLLLVSFDVLFVGMGSSLLVNYCRPKEFI